MQCVESVQYAVKVNHDLVGSIVPSRGLLQGDPLSPYLYLICVEGLSALIWQARLIGNLHGISIFPGAPEISHLLFADNCFLS